MLAKLFLIFDLVAIGFSFTLPGGLSNGLYKAYYDAAGEEVHELITADTFTTRSLPTALDPVSFLSKRQSFLSSGAGVHFL